MTEEHFSAENVKNLFDFLDNHEQGYLTKESLLLTFQRNAREIEMHQVESMMEELGISVDAKIGLD